MWKGMVFYDNDGHLKNWEEEWKNFLKKNISPAKMEELKNREILGIKTNTPPTRELKNLLCFWDIILNPGLHTREPYQWINPFLFLFFLFPLFFRDRISMWLYFVTLIIAIPIASMTFLIRYTIFLILCFSLGAGLCVSKISWRSLSVLIWTALFLITVYGCICEWNKNQKNFWEASAKMM